MSNITNNPSVPSQIIGKVTFPKFMNTLGIIPTSYKDSMDFYEILTWLCKFLEETVIPTVSQNGEAVIELQRLYIQLHDYVDHYFENLDVQEEINNKLEEMIESGTLQEIISAYLNSKAIFGFDDVESMVNSENLIEGSYARTLGFMSINDEEGALFKIRKITNEDIVDGITIISILTDNTLVAELIVEENIVRCATVNSIKSLSKIYEGLVIKTLGYYSVNDGGQAEYIIRTSEPSSYYETIRTGLYAELIIDKEINVLQLGLKPNEESSLKIQSIFNLIKNKKIKFNEGTYLINNKLNLENNIIFGNNTIIKCNDNFASNVMLEISENIQLNNISFDGNNKVTSIINENPTINEEIINCKFFNCLTNLSNSFPLTSCVYLTGKKVIFKNSEVYNNQSHGLRAYAIFNDSSLIVDNCKFYNNGDNEIAACGFCEYSRNNGEKYSIAKITNSEAYNNGASGFALHSINNVECVNCNSYNNKEHGYVLMDGKNGKIVNCNSKNNSSVGIRVQGDYNAEDYGYDNYLIKNNVIEDNGGIWISHNIKNGIVKDNLIIAQNNPKYGILIGDLIFPLSNFENNLIVNNILKGFIYYPNFINTSIKFKKSNNIYNNICEDKIVNGATYNTLYIGRILDSNNLKYGISNNVLAAPTDFSDSAWSTGTISDDSIIPTSGKIAMQNVNLFDNKKPKYISVILKLKEVYSEVLSISLRFRGLRGTLINFSLPNGQSLNEAGWLSKNQNDTICQIFDMDNLSFNEPIKSVEIFIKTATNHQVPIKLEYCYLSYSNELPILPVT